MGRAGRAGSRELFKGARGALLLCAGQEFAVSDEDIEEARPPL